MQLGWSAYATFYGFDSLWTSQCRRVEPLGFGWSSSSWSWWTSAHTTSRAQASKFNIQERSTQIEEQLVCDAKNWDAPVSIPRPLVMDTKYILIFFSGHRRWGDIASWVSWLGIDNSIIPISVDIGLHAVYGDIYNGQLWEG